MISNYFPIKFWSIGIALPVLMGVAITGCTPGEASLRRKIVFPDEFVIKAFDSYSDRSGLHGPNFFSFASTDEEFEDFVDLNSLKSMDFIPEKYASTINYVTKIAKQKVWPSVFGSFEIHMYSNYQLLDLNAPEYPELFMTIHYSKKMYVILAPLY